MKRNVVICLDESGNFERYENRIRFIGGFIYEGEEWESEKLKLQRLLSDACKEGGLAYPNDLHAVKEQNDEKKKKAMKDVRRQLFEHMGKNKKYRFFALFHKGKPSDLHAGNIADDSKGSNFYENMLSKVLLNLLARFPLYMPDHIDAKIEVATRSIEIENSDTEKIGFYHEMGYDHKKFEDKTRFYLTKQQTVKTILQLFTQENKDPKVNINGIKVESINYKNEQEGQAGLYAADLCCDYIRSLFRRNDNLGDVIAIKEKEMHEELNNAPAIFVYGEKDEQWSRLAACFHKRDYFGFLDMYQQMEEEKSPLDNFYYTYYAAKLLPLMKNEGIPETAFSCLFDAVEKRCFHEGEYGRAQRILELLYNNFAAENIRVRFEIAGMLMRTYIHMGDNEKSIYYRDKCKECSQILQDSELYINFQNRCISQMTNEFRFQEALDLTTELLKAQRLVWDGKQKAAESLFHKKSVLQKDLMAGKLCSTAGQLNAFLGCYDSSANNFKTALSFIDDPNNRNITLSYLLHMAICSNNLKLYKEHEGEFFGLKTEGASPYLLLKNEFEASLKDRFVLFVYLKAFYQFFADKPDYKEILEKIVNTDYTGDTKAHPYGLIFKYLTLLADKAGLENKRTEYYEKAKAFGGQNKFILQLIQKAALVELAANKEDREEKNLELGIFIEQACDKNKALREYFKDVFDPQAKSTDYTRYFTYMYS